MSIEALTTPSASLISGMLLCMAVNSLVNDFLGLEISMAAMRINWVTGWVTVPLAILLMLVAFTQQGYAGYCLAKDEDEE